MSERPASERLRAACVLQPKRECGEARALGRLILAGAPESARGRLQLEVRALRELGYSFDEAASFAAGLDARVLELLAEQSGEVGDLLVRARALQELSAERGHLLARVYFEAARAPAAGTRPASFAGIVGRSPPMRELFAQLETAARGRETILVVGESGVGKELVARAIHTLSGDRPERWIAVNCAAIPRELLESELFGHRRGAFSGALCNYPGLVRSASGGTLFLDEVVELPPDAQAKLLRVIQERRVRPVGDPQEHPIAVRIVASTNRPIAETLGAGVLRRDLYYRLQRLVIEVPPLRARLEDLPLLAEHFVEKWAAAYRERELPRLSAAALARLAAYGWPGNVRELENAIFAACARSRGRAAIDADALLLDAPLAPPSAPPPAETSEAVLSLEQAEAAAIRRALEACDGNKSHASRMLGISRKQLYVKLRSYGLL